MNELFGLLHDLSELAFEIGRVAEVEIFHAARTSLNRLRIAARLAIAWPFVLFLVALPSGKYWPVHYIVLILTILVLLAFLWVMTTLAPMSIFAAETMLSPKTVIVGKFVEKAREVMNAIRVVLGLELLAGIYFSWVPIANDRALALTQILIVAAIVCFVGIKKWEPVVMALAVAFCLITLFFYLGGRGKISETLKSWGTDLKATSQKVSPANEQVPVANQPNAEIAKAETTLPAPEPVRLRKITPLLYSYSSSKWSGEQGASIDDVNLQFWAGLVGAYANVHWRGSYTIDASNLCLTITGLQIPTRTLLGKDYSDFGVGYGVELGNAVFEDQSMARVLMLYRTFLGDSAPPEIHKCFPIEPIPQSDSESIQMKGQWQGSTDTETFTLRLDQRGNKFEGSEMTIPADLPAGTSETKQRAQIEGWIYGNRVTFIRRAADSLIGSSFAGSFDAADTTVHGTWYAGVDKGSWSMQRTGDLVGDVNDFASPGFANPPDSKSGEQPLQLAITQDALSSSEVSKVPAQQMELNRISGPDPVYPPIAKASRIEGDVLLEARISKDGEVESVQVLSGPSMLQQPAAEAVKQWKYRPFLSGGIPVEVVTQVKVSFTLNN